MAHDGGAIVRRILDGAAGLEQRQGRIARVHHYRVIAPGLFVPALETQDVSIPGDRALHIAHGERDVIDPLDSDRQFIPQTPGLLHIPLGQTGASEREDVPPFACAENVEYCWLTCFCPQEGQFTSAVSAGRRTSFSNFVLQSSQ